MVRQRRSLRANIYLRLGCSIAILISSSCAFEFSGLFREAPANKIRIENNEFPGFSEMEGMADPAMEREAIIRLFSKLGDDRILIDHSRGLCCYAGCPGCDFLNDDGSYKYSKYIYAHKSRVEANDEDEFVTAAVIPYYAYRNVGGDEQHTTRWSQVLFPKKQRMIQENEFISLLKSADCAIVLNSHDPMVPEDDDFNQKYSEVIDQIVSQPSSLEKVEDGDSREKYDVWAAKELWKVLAVSAIDGKVGLTLTKAQAANSFRKLVKSDRGTIEGIGVASFEAHFLSKKV